MTVAKSIWAAALTLEERAQQRSPAVGHERSAEQHRIDYWRETPAFRDPAVFAHFLNSMRLTDSLFRELIVPSSSSEFQAINPIHYLRDLEGLIGSSGVAQDMTEGPEEGFVSIVSPLVHDVVTRLKEAVAVISSHNPEWFDQETLVSSLKDLLIDCLSLVITRPLVIEINVSRRLGQLAGATPQARFSNFVERLADPELRSEILQRYPVMVRQALLICRQWYASSREMLERFCNDRREITRFFRCESAGRLTEVTALSGDSHAGGKQVLLLTFGCGLRLVYKPRPQAAAKLFADFTSWLNSKGLAPQLRPVSTLDCGAYGWTEFVEASPCISSLEVRNYYRRVGSQLAALYVLGGTDCHFENLIAAGEHPVLVDLETLFHPRLRHKSIRTDAIDVVPQFLSDSVMSVGLLPTPMLLNDAIVDLSGIGAKSFQETPLETFGLENAGTDEVRVAQKLFRTDQLKNQPVQSASEAGVSRYLKFVDAGFRQAYELIRRWKSELLSDAGILAVGRNIQTRVLLRNTSAYSSLLEQSLHPKALRDGLARDRVLGQLWFAVSSRPAMSAVVKSEYEQMLAGDIPIFFARPSDTTVVSGCNEAIAGLVETCGYDVVRSRLERLCDADLAHQCWLISSSICSLGAVEDECARHALRLGSNATYLDVALQVGRRLADLAVYSGAHVSWLSLDASHPRPDTSFFSIQQVTVDLYDGLAGIALFLGCLGNFTNQEEFTVLARHAVEAIEARLGQQHQTARLGAFEGLCGIVYAYSHLGRLWQDKAILLRAETIAAEIEGRVREDQCFDLVSGAAGCTLALLALHNANPRSRALKVARVFGDHLISADLLSNSNDTRYGRLRYRRGMSHGFAGIAYSLFELSVRSGEQRFANSGLSFADAERTLLSDGVWTDDDDERLRSQATWCHGSPGIALSRLGILRHIDCASVRHDAERALHDSVDNLGLSGHGLCHGQLGILAALTLAGEVLTSGKWREISRVQADEIRRDIALNGCRTERPGSVDVPGLMTGLAGIGLWMLRLTDENAAPNVLLLQ